MQVNHIKNQYLKTGERHVRLIKLSKSDIISIVQDFILDNQVRLFQLDSRDNTSGKYEIAIRFLNDGDVAAYAYVSELGTVLISDTDLEHAPYTDSSIESSCICHSAIVSDGEILRTEPLPDLQQREFGPKNHFFTKVFRRVYLHVALKSLQRKEKLSEKRNAEEQERKHLSDINIKK